MPRPSRHGRLVLLLLVLLTTVGARRRTLVPPFLDVPPPDAFSAANAEVRTEHLSLDLTVDFDARRIRGSAVHRIANPRGARSFVLDTRDLDIDAVRIDGSPTTWRLGDSTDNGRPLAIDIQPGTREVRIDYSSRPNASALLWLNAKQTRGRVMPFVWTQGEPDHTRSWIPVQDSPAIRMTWEATVRVPPGMMAVMSAPNATAPNDLGIYTFSMRHSVPAYLIVLAAGRLAFRSLDDRTGIYAEPELLDDAVYEMQFIPGMLHTAERLLGPYPWDRYDLLFPPAFGGGMENPDLNFISPDAITGNHPQPVVPSTLIAHEMAHSWTGDMVTCATWSDLWLNEGFATYLEKRIMEEMAGWERAEVGLFGDRRAYSDYLNDSRPPSRITVLHRQFTSSERPGNAFNIVSYQKGELFLKMLEDRLGRQDFDAAVQRHLQASAFHWADDRAFLAALRPALLGRPAEEVEELAIDEWLYGSGLPSNVTAPTRSAMWDRVAVQANAFRNGRSATQLATAGWTVIETNLFLQMTTDILRNRLADVDAAFHFGQMTTPPIHYLLAIARSMDPSRLPILETYLMRGTSASFPVWSELANTAQGRQYALGIYARARDFYSPNGQAYLDSVLRFSPAGLAEAA